MRILKIHSLPKALVVYMLLAFTLVACDADKNEAELVTSAKEYVAKKELRAAIIELKNTLQENPKNAEARYLLGQVNYQVGDMPAAEKEFDRALDYGWNPEQAYVGLLMSLVGQNKSVV